MKYRVYFEAFGKKLKTIVEANSETEAMHSIRNQIEILKIEEVGGDSGDEAVERLKTIFNMK